jgi:hypothetical protein
MKSFETDAQVRHDPEDLHEWDVHPLPGGPAGRFVCGCKRDGVQASAEFYPAAVDPKPLRPNGLRRCGAAARTTRDDCTAAAQAGM